jgi:anti-sigma factor RsiW
MERTNDSHSRHDELLIARLFGGDVSDRERTRALGLVGECHECADLFADIGATADAIVAMPVAARPRDFTLSEADAARVGMARRRLSLPGVFRPARALGRSMVALGLIGVVATGSLSLLGKTETGNYSGPNSVPALAVGSAAAENDYAVATGAQAPGESAGSKGQITADGTSEPKAGETARNVPPTPASSGPAVEAMTSPVPSVPASQPAFDAGGTDGSTSATNAATGGMDARLFLVAGFGLLFVAGLLVLALPRVWRRRIG